MNAKARLCSEGLGSSCRELQSAEIKVFDLNPGLSCKLLQTAVRLKWHALQNQELNA